MKVLNILFSCLLILVIITGCSREENPVQVEKKYLNVAITEQTLIVQNRESESVYYFVAEWNEFPNTEWKPFSISEENEISPNQRTEIRFEEIPGYTENSETLLFYYWYKSGIEKKELHGYSLTIN